MRNLRLRRAALDYIWLYDLRAGVSLSEIARRQGVPEKAVRDGIRRARRAEPAPPSAMLASIPENLDVIPLFPVGALTPTSDCPHRRGIPAGSRLYCVVCHGTGFDAPPSGPESSAPAASRPRPEPTPRRTAGH